MHFQLFVGVLCLSLLCYSLLFVHSSLAIILKRMRKLVALLFLSYRCIVTINVMWLSPAVPWVVLQCVIVVFTDHTHLLFFTFDNNSESNLIKNGIQWQIAIMLFVLVCLKNGNFATLVFDFFFNSNFHIIKVLSQLCLKIIMYYRKILF